MIGLSLLDSLNPVTIATMLVIIPAVKQKKDSLLFMISTYLVYSVSGIIILFGLGTIFSEYFNYIIESIKHIFTTMRYIIVLTLALLSFFYTYKLYIKFKERTFLDYVPSPLMVKLTTPFAIFILGLYSTFLDLPTALPYIGFISIMTTQKASILLSLILVFSYCFIYVSPMIFVYLFSKNKKFFKFQNKVLKNINIANQFILPIFLLALSIFLLYI